MFTAALLTTVKTWKQDFPGGTVEKTSPADAGNTGSIPGPRRFHVLCSD